MHNTSVEYEEFHLLFIDLIRNYKKKYPEDNVFSDFALKNSMQLCALVSKEETHVESVNNVFVYPH